MRRVLPRPFFKCQISNSCMMAALLFASGFHTTADGQGLTALSRSSTAITRMLLAAFAHTKPKPGHGINFAVMTCDMQF